MAYGALEIREYSPLSSITDAGSNRRQPSWAEGLSPVSTDNNHSSWIAEEEEDDVDDALVTVGYKSVPAKLFTNEKEHLLQIQVCWACRLELSQSADKKLLKVTDDYTHALKVPHFAVSSWDDIANIIHSDNGVDASEMVFWLKQQMFQSNANLDGADSVTTSASSFDALCSSSAEDYAKATDIQTALIFPVEEACLRCRRTSLLPVILDESQDSRHAVQSAILFKESALKARAIGAQAKKFVASAQSHTLPSLSAPSTPFTTSAAIKRHVTESPPDGRRRVVSLFNAIGLNEHNWKPRPHFNRQFRVPSYNRWSPASGGINTGSTEYSVSSSSLVHQGSGSPQRRRPLRKPGSRRKMSSDRGQIL